MSNDIVSALLPAIFQTCLELDTQDVWNGFFLHALVLDHMKGMNTLSSSIMHLHKLIIFGLNSLLTIGEWLALARRSGIMYVINVVGFRQMRMGLNARVCLPDIQCKYC